MIDEDSGERRRREPRPIDAAQLQELALGYAARYATTVAKLRRYLVRKLRERVWRGAGAPDVDALIERIARLGYVNDRAYAVLKSRELTGRGFGQRRVRSALAAAGVGREDSAAVEVAENPYGAAIAFARRRRFGPFAREGVAHDPVRQRRELAAMARAGHDFEVARSVLAAADEAAAGMLAED